MKLEDGKYYKGADGKKYGPMRKTDNEYWPLTCCCESSDTGLIYSDYSGFTQNGIGSRTTPNLIAPWPAEVGTLAEIGAQVGDVVSASWKGSHQWADYTWVKKHPDYGFECLLCCKTGTSYIRIGDIGIWDFRIVSRATDSQTGPVITETVTTKKIVRGVYGAVSVSVDDDGDKIIDLRHGLRTAAELRAAIATLTEIAEAME